MRALSQQFGQRFMLLSAALHAGPILGAPIVGRSCAEVDPSPQPVAERPFGVSLLYVETPPESGVEELARAPAAANESSSSETSEHSRVSAPQQARRDHTVAKRAFDEATPVAPRGGHERVVRGYSVGVPVTLASAAGFGREPEHTGSRPESGPHSTDVTVATDLVVQPSAAPVPADRLRSRQRLQQDRKRAIAMIERRIQRVMPLVYWNTKFDNRVAGQVRVRFRMARSGYVRDIEVIEVAGEVELRAATHAVLHLAEPYNFVPNWIELDLEFRG